MCFFLKHGLNNPRNSEGAFVQLSDGRLFFAYSRYSGKDWYDHCRADICAVVSADSGRTWSPPEVIVKNQDLNVMSVSLLRLQNSRIAMLFLKKSPVAGTAFVDCRPQILFSADETSSWSLAKSLMNLPPLYLVVHNDRLIQLKNGRLLLPVTYHRYCGESMVYGSGIGLFYLSDDGGDNWRQSKECCYPPQWLDSGLMEPGAVELMDGRILCWFRTTGGCQYKAWSDDGGESWTEPIPAPEFPSPSAPLSMKRNPGTGELIAIWNDYSPARSVHFREGVMGRTPLVLAKSRDEGKTWTDHIVLEDALDHGFAYTTIDFGANHLFLAYCCGGLAACECMLQDIKIRVIPLD